MRDRFISRKNIGAFDSIVNMVSPLMSSAQNRVALFSQRREVCRVTAKDGPVDLGLLDGFDVLYCVKRAAQRTLLKVTCGTAKDEKGFEYKIQGQLDVSVTIRDNADSIERAIRDFDAEFIFFSGLVESQMRNLVGIFVEDHGKMHATLDGEKCRLGLEQTVRQANACFEVVQVHMAMFGDPNWETHRARHFEVEETEEQAAFKQTLRRLTRKEGVMRASEPLVELQRKYAAKAEAFRRNLEKAEAEHKIEKARLAVNQLGPEAGIAIIDPTAYGMMSAHTERMSEIEKKALAEFKEELVAILRRRII